MKKISAAVFVILFAGLLLIYIKTGDFIKSAVFLNVQNFTSKSVFSGRVMFVSDDFDLSDYNNLLDKLSGAGNPVTLFLPQVVNVRVSDYLDNIDPETIRIQKAEYNKLALKLAESENVITVFFSSPGSAPEDRVDLSQFKYFDFSAGLRLPGYEYIKIINRKIWHSAKNIAFYSNYSYYPYKMPVLFRNGDAVIVNSAIEGVRKYFKLTKSQVKYRNRTLSVGATITLPLLPTGELIIKKPGSNPKTYSLKEALELPGSEFTDKIVIVRSMSVSEDTMLSLGAAVDAIMKGEYVKYNGGMNYAAAVILAMFFFFVYRSLRFRYGIAVFLFSVAGLAAVTIAALNNNIYIDLTLLTAANLFVFFSVYYFYLWNREAEYRSRKGVISRYVHPLELKNFFKKNRDVETKNSWIGAGVFYISFGSSFGKTPGEVKETFEKIRQAIYDKEKQFLIKIESAAEITAVLTRGGIEPHKIVEVALALRDSLEGKDFNIIFSDTQVYAFEYNGELFLLDKDPETAEAAKKLDKNRRIVMSEMEIKKYLSIIKFQKLGNIEGKVFFSITGFRETKA